MAQEARQADDEEFVTKGALREELAAMEARLMEAITYTNKLNEQVLDSINPAWRETA